VPWRKPRRSWKVAPASLAEAFRLCREHGIERKRLSVDRLAELMATTPATLYKWMEDGTMPAHRIAQFEHFTGAHFVSDYLAISSGRVVVPLPTGRPDTAEDISGLQLVCHEAIASLIRCWRGESDIDETVSALTMGLKALAWERENVQRRDRPELDLSMDEETGDA